MIRNSSEDIGKPGAGINVIQFAGFDQRIDGGSPAATGVAAAECPVFAPDGDAAHRALGGVVAHADAAVIKEARERGPSLEVTNYLMQGFQKLMGLLPKPQMETPPVGESQVDHQART